MNDNDFLENTLKILERSCKAGGIEDNYFKILSRPSRSLKVEYPAYFDNGEIQMIRAYRVQHTNAPGPYKGGIRISEQANENEVTALSILMSLKCAIAGLPYGGSKGSICVDHKKLSRNELERVCRGYMRAIYPIIGPDVDIPAPDMNVPEEAIGWMMDEYERTVYHHAPFCITGKPLELGGIKGRKTAVAWGGIYIMEELEKAFSCKCGKFAIQGAGNVGGNMARILHEKNKKVVALSDSSGAAFNEEGLDIPSLMRHKEKTGSVLGFNGAEDITNESLLGLDVDILVPAAKEDQITAKNASKISARTVLSLANGPITDEASKMLEGRGIIVVPDILANSGGVIVSYFEWVQGKEGYAWSGSRVSSSLKESMKRSFRDVLEISKEYKQGMYTSAYILGVKNLVKAMKARSY
jgi:glutamate dehydrogenase/leucine dehydrogenase